MNRLPSFSMPPIRELATSLWQNRPSWRVCVNGLATQPLTTVSAVAALSLWGVGFAKWYEHRRYVNHSVDLTAAIADFTTIRNELDTLRANLPNKKRGDCESALFKILPALDRIGRSAGIWHAWHTHPEYGQAKAAVAEILTAMTDKRDTQETKNLDREVAAFVKAVAPLIKQHHDNTESDHYKLASAQYQIFNNAVSAFSKAGATRVERHEALVRMREAVTACALRMREALTECALLNDVGLKQTALDGFIRRAATMSGVALTQGQRDSLNHLNELLHGTMASPNDTVIDSLTKRCNAVQAQRRPLETNATFNWWLVGVPVALGAGILLIGTGIQVWAPWIQLPKLAVGEAVQAAAKVVEEVAEPVAEVVAEVAKGTAGTLASAASAATQVMPDSE